MVQKIINTGSSELAGDGESIRSAFLKINDNFNELYAKDATDFDGDYNSLTNKPTIPADVSDLTDTTNLLSGGGADTGDVTFNGVKVIGAGTASGDGNGYSTLELVPDNSLYDNDQYLVIDPTDPYHIHIRAGGTQDDSQAELYLGGEANYVRVADSGGIRIQNQTRTDLFYNYADPADFNTATWYESSGSYFVEYTTANTELINVSFQFNDDNENTLRVYYNGGANNSLLTSSGSISNLGSGVYRVSVNEAPPASPTNISEFEYTIWETRTNSLQLQSNDFTVSVVDDIRITGDDTFSLRNTSTTESITIRTDYDGTDHSWDFGADGNLLLPENGTLSFNSGGLAGRIIPSVSDGVGLQIEATLDFEIKVNNGESSSSIWSFAGSEITFPDSTVQNTAYPGIVSTHNGQHRIEVGGQTATMDSLRVRLAFEAGPDNTNVELNYDPDVTTGISVDRRGTNLIGVQVTAPGNTDWVVIDTLNTAGDGTEFVVTDHSLNKIYRVTVTVSNPHQFGSVIGDAYCVIERLK